MLVLTLCPLYIILFAALSPLYLLNKTRYRWWIVAKTRERFFTLSPAWNVHILTSSLRNMRCSWQGVGQVNRVGQKGIQSVCDKVHELCSLSMASHALL